MSSAQPRRQNSTSGTRKADAGQRHHAGPRRSDDEQRHHAGPRRSDSTAPRHNDDAPHRPAGPRRNDDDQRPKRQYSEQYSPRVPREPRKQEFVTANTGYGTQEPIEKSKFLEGLNTLKLSSDIHELCDQVGITDNNLIDIAQTSFNNAYYYVFNFELSTYATTWEANILKAYDIKPYVQMSDELINDIATMKWNIYCAYKAHNITETIVKFIGIVAGICSYFEQIDIMNVNTKYYTKLKSDHTYNDIKLL